MVDLFWKVLEYHSHFLDWLSSFGFWGNIALCFLGIIYLGSTVALIIIAPNFITLCAKTGARFGDYLARKFMGEV